ncbi:hypothetical protein [Streptococcus suis]|uniref:hypothetical protein n=1 Tax=Streptococcus suis TaxID=1307 RepID=UPI002A7862DD|nr:hypothetical protein [Streptococcus suis]HEM5056694.1 hypothetical protein [Streptococcus suis]HEM5059505.1 hypothetical protein [Streptococcus suis]HEM5061625.1 hypothetical protein [Streptococcus suis]HEM5063766.1 hypothetical protein [Streptococcus suis]
MEKLRKESWKNLVLATLIILSMYAGMYLLAFHLVSDTMVSKGLVVGNILIYTPVVLFFLGLVYGLFKGFSIWLLILVFLLYPVTICFFQEWIVVYQIAYTLCAIFGNGLGALLFSKRKKLKENP